MKGQALGCDWREKPSWSLAHCAPGPPVSTTHPRRGQRATATGTGTPRGTWSPHLDLGQQVFEGCVELVWILQLLPGARDATSEALGPSASPNTLPLHTTLTPSPSPVASSPSLLKSGESNPKNLRTHSKQAAPLPAPPRPLLTNAGDTLHRDLPHTLLEAAEPRVDLSDLGLFAFNQLLDDLRGGRV